MPKGEGKALERKPVFCAHPYGVTMGGSIFRCCVCGTPWDNEMKAVIIGYIDPGEDGGRK